MITEKIHEIYLKIKSHRIADVALQTLSPEYFNYDYQINNPTLHMNRTYPLNSLHLAERMIARYFIIDQIFPGAGLATKLFLGINAGVGANAIENIIGIATARTYLLNNELENLITKCREERV